MKKKVIDYVPENKSLPLIVGILTVTAFILGFNISSSIITDYSQQSVVPETKFFTIFKTKVDTVYVEKKFNVAVINENAYGDRNFGYRIRNLNAIELRQKLQQIGFKNLDELDFSKLRRLWLLYNYNDMLMNVHLLTDFPVSMIYSFFIIEATNVGIETDLWRIHANAGGVKALKGHKHVTYSTREVIGGKNKRIRAKFFSTNDTKEGIALWSGVLNSDRYKKCKVFDEKPPKLYKKICKCIYKSGYHTDTDYEFRASLMQEYWNLKKHLPE
ncbi:MAG: hypothetical protein EBR82_81175 [Caulobacteraceae bacterium]|nr:hypothetical protein [Caulobacteraceae bacterium]